MRFHTPKIVGIVVALAAVACGSEGGGTLGGSGTMGGQPSDPNGNNPSPGGGPTTNQGGNTGDMNGGMTGNPTLDARVINYSEALRTASLKLVGALPSLDDIEGPTPRRARRPSTKRRSTRPSRIRAALANPVVATR